jgi:hypothetical protein
MLDTRFKEPWFRTGRTLGSQVQIPLVTLMFAYVVVILRHVLLPWSSIKDLDDFILLLTETIGIYKREEE